jgi:hypothetical protein
VGRDAERPDARFEREPDVGQDEEQMRERWIGIEGMPGPQLSSKWIASEWMSIAQMENR